MLLTSSTLGIQHEFLHLLITGDTLLQIVNLFILNINREKKVRIFSHSTNLVFLSTNLNLNNLMHIIF